MTAIESIRCKACSCMAAADVWEEDGDCPSCLHSEGERGTWIPYLVSAEIETTDDKPVSERVRDAIRNYEAEEQTDDRA